MARLTLRKRGGVFWAKLLTAMPTIAEIIAAKKAANTAAQPVTNRPELDLSHDPMLEAAINRIDPPSAGKRRAGLVLSAKTPLQPAEVAMKAHHAELRSLSQPQGEAIPLTPCNATKEVETWHEATNAFESQLCAMRDPQDSDVVWLAIRADRDGLPPILLNRLPWTLWDYPHPPTDRQPF
jgi:hypothetical protein